VFVTFPGSAKIEVSSALAKKLLKAAEGLPLYQNEEFYSSTLQLFVMNQIRESSPEEFDALADLIKSRITQWPYCVLLQGLRFDEGNRLFVAINRAFGELVARPYEKPRAQLVHYIQPETDLPSTRGGLESERLHTDTADWETPVELISMLCVHADPGGGGRSRVLDIDSIRQEVEGHLGIDTLHLMQTERVPWRLATYRGGGVKWQSVLTESSICWRRYTIELALESEGTRLSQQMYAALDAFENLIGRTQRTVDFLLREGELLIADNHRTIHARTPILSNSSNRLMIRSWIRGEQGGGNGIRPNL
jgi:alpha-ketoglutarate-dependent taurine dioxygenase